MSMLRNAERAASAICSSWWCFTKCVEKEGKEDGRLEADAGVASNDDRRSIE